MLNDAYDIRKHLSEVEKCWEEFTEELKGPRIGSLSEVYPEIEELAYEWAESVALIQGAYRKVVEDTLDRLTRGHSMVMVTKMKELANALGIKHKVFMSPPGYFSPSITVQGKEFLSRDDRCSIDSANDLVCDIKYDKYGEVTGLLGCPIEYAKIQLLAEVIREAHDDDVGMDWSYCVTDDIPLN